MSHPEVGRNHCFECGKAGVKYGSLFPLEGIEVPESTPSLIVDDEENQITNMRFNVDFNVCPDCYIEQFQRRYPGEEVPYQVYRDKELDAIQDTYKQKDLIAAAKAILQQAGITEV